MKDDTTRALSKTLESVHIHSDTENFIQSHAKCKYNTFCQYLNAIIADKQLITSDVIKRSGINRNYVYNILNGTKNPCRDKIIALCIGSRMNYQETQRALEIAEFSPLYPRNERDIRIAVAINRGVEDLISLNLELEANCLEPLRV